MEAAPTYSQAQRVSKGSEEVILTKSGKNHFAERDLPHLLPMCGNAAGLFEQTLTRVF